MGKQLFDFSRPVDMLFHPPRHYRSRQFLPPLHASQPSTSSPLAPGGATPMPDCSTSLSPAWNPSSRTPGWEPSFDAPTATLPSPISPPIASTSRVAAVQEPPQHPLLNPLLVGISLKANITEKDGKVKEQNISIVENNGRPRLIRTVFVIIPSILPVILLITIFFFIIIYFFPLLHCFSLILFLLVIVMLPLIILLSIILFSLTLFFLIILFLCNFISLIDLIFPCD